MGLNPVYWRYATRLQIPRSVCRFFVDELLVSRFDILLPDVTHDDARLPIATYYKRLFDLWYDDFSAATFEFGMSLILSWAWWENRAPRSLWVMVPRHQLWFIRMEE